MNDLDDLIAEAREQAAYLRGVSRDGSMPYSGELLGSLADALASVRAERDAALEVMSNHKCGENVEAAYRRAVDAEARIAELEVMAKMYDRACDDIQIYSEQIKSYETRIAELEKSRDRWEELCGKIASEKYDLNARIAEAAKLHQCFVAPNGFRWCSGCSTDEYPEDWPCETAVALGLNEGENND